MIEVKINDIVKSIVSFRKLMNMDIKEEGHASLSYKWSKIVKIVDSEIEEFYKQNQKLLDTYGDKTEIVNGQQQYKIKDEYIEVFNKEIKELGEQIVKIDKDKVKVENIEKQKISLSPLDFSQLEWLIQE